jgi:hypothetical protein
MPLLSAMLLAIFLSPAYSRPWKPTSVQLADDYSTIQDRKSNTDFVMIKWWAQPTAMPGSPLAAILEKYVVISIVRFHIILPGGSFSFDDIEPIDALGSNGHPLTPVPENALLPTAIAVLAAVKAAFRQSAGRMGEGTKFFTFDADAVRACEKGKLSVPFAGETYFWETPFPGCS